MKHLFIILGLCSAVAGLSCDKEEPKPAAATGSAAATQAASAEPAATATATASATGAAVASASATAAASADAALPPHLDGAVVDAAEGVGEAPAAADWEAAPETTVTGSTRAGCVTKVLNSWFFARCSSDEEGLGRLKSATVVSGLRRGQTSIEEKKLGADEFGRPLLAYDIVTPFTKGTSFSVNLQWIKGSNLDLVISWPDEQDKAPARTGEVKQAPDRTAK